MTFASRAVALLQKQYESVYRQMRQSQWLDEFGTIVSKAKNVMTPLRYAGRDCHYRTMENLEQRMLMTTLYWDADAAAGLQAGSGAWDTTATNWNTAADGSGTRVAWIDGADAVFATDGTSSISISTGVIANSLIFNGTGYTITGNTLTLIGSANITVNQNAEITSIISGISGLNAAGSNELTITGYNLYTGNTTISSGSTLQIKTTGSAEINNSFINNGILIFNNDYGSGATYSGVISGIGNLYIKGNGLVNLSGANTFTGLTKIYHGFLNIYNSYALSCSTFDTDAAYETYFFNTPRAVYFGGLIGRGHVYYGGKIVVGGNNTDCSFEGTIDGTLVKVGTGTLTLAGSSPIIADASKIMEIHSGILRISNSSVTTSNASIAITENEGILAIDADVTIGRIQGVGAILLESHMLTFSGDNDIGYQGDITGTGGIILQNNADVTLFGANSYTGNTIVNAGCYLQLGKSSELSPTPIESSSIVNNGELRFSGFGVLSEHSVISGNGLLTVSMGAMTIKSSNTFTGTIKSDWSSILFQNSLAFQYATFVGDYSTYANFFDFGNLSTVTIGGISGSFDLWNSNSNPNVVDVLVGNNNLDQTYSGNIQANINLVKIGTGKLTLTGTNFNGTTIIEEGKLQIGAGGTVGTLVVTGDIINNGELIINRSNALTISNNISGTGTITKMGTGALTLSGNNSFSGHTYIGQGTITLSGGNALIYSVIELANVSGVKLILSDENETIGAIYGGGTTGGNVVLGAHSLKIGTINYNPQNYYLYSGVISGTGAIIINECSLIFTGANTYTGGTSISSMGYLQLGYNTTTGSLSTGAIWNDGTFVFNRSNALTFANAIDGNGIVAQIGVGTLTLTGANTYSGYTYIAGNSTLQMGAGSTAGTLGTGYIYNDGNLIINRSNAVTVASDIVGAGSLTKAGAGALTLSGFNEFTGTTTINAGSLILSGGYALADSSNVVLANVASAKLMLADNEAIGSLSGGGTTGGNVALGSYELNVLNNADTTYAGVISGTGSIVKSGAGMLTLTRVNTYTGATTVAGGTLNISGSLVSNVTVMSDAILTGVGTITGDVQVNSGGIIGPPSGLGVLHLKNLTLSAGSIVAISINTYTAGTGYGQISISGLLTINGATLQLSGTRTTAAGKTLTLFNCTSTSAISGTFSGIGQGSTVQLNNLNYTASYTGGTGNDFVLIDQ